MNQQLSFSDRYKLSFVQSRDGGLSYTVETPFIPLGVKNEVEAGIYPTINGLQVRGKNMLNLGALSNNWMASNLIHADLNDFILAPGVYSPTGVVGSGGTSFDISKGLILGDSISSSTFGAYPIDYYALNFLDRSKGNTVQNIAIPGGLINEQKIVFDALDDKTIYDWVLINLGVNDFLQSHSLATMQTDIDSLIADVVASCKPTVKIILSHLSPCCSYSGGAYYSTVYPRWTGFNAYLSGKTYPIMSSYLGVISDGAGTLLPLYDTGDSVHCNDAGRQQIGLDLRSVLLAQGFLS